MTSNSEQTAVNRLDSTSEADDITERDFLKRYLDFRSPSSSPYDQLLVAEEDEQSSDDVANERFKGEQPLLHQSHFNRPWETVSSASFYRPWESSTSSISTTTDPHLVSLIHRSTIDGDQTLYRSTDGVSSSRTMGGRSIDSGFSSVCSSPIDGPGQDRVESTGATRTAKVSSGFSPWTIQILESWYSANVRYPYPSNEIVRHLAVDAGVTVRQARKWMANRRARSFNTMTYNGAIHPKRLRSLSRHLPPYHQQPQQQQPQLHQHQQPLVSTSISQLQASSSSCTNVEQSMTCDRSNDIQLKVPWPMTSTLSSALCPASINHERLQFQNCNGTVGSYRTSENPDVLQRPTTWSSPISDPRLYHRLHSGHVQRLEEMWTPLQGSTGSWNSWTSATPSPVRLLSSLPTAPMATRHIAPWSYFNSYL